MSDLSLSARFGKSVGVGILSWKSEETLSDTLQSHVNKGLFDLFDRVLIHFQEIHPRDKELAGRFGLDYIGSSHNRHIGGGFYHLIRNLDTDYIFLLEDDLTLDKDRDDLYRALCDGLYLSERKDIDIFRCRRRGNLQSTYTKYRKIRELDRDVNDVDFDHFAVVSSLRRFVSRLRRPFHAGRTIGKAPWVEKHPEQIFPRHIRRVPALYNDVYVLTGKATKWSNPAIFARRSTLLEVYHHIARETPGFEEFGLSLEKLVNKRHRKWWLKQGYRIGVTKEILIDHARGADGGKTNEDYIRVK